MIYVVRGYIGIFGLGRLYRTVWDVGLYMVVWGSNVCIYVYMYTIVIGGHVIYGL